MVSRAFARKYGTDSLEGWDRWTGDKFALLGRVLSSSRYVILVILHTRATIVIVGISECRARTMSSISFSDWAIIKRSAKTGIFLTAIDSGITTVNSEISSFFISTSESSLTLLCVDSAAGMASLPVH